jgi:hypothetical protein
LFSFLAGIQLGISYSTIIVTRNEEGIPSSLSTNVCAPCPKCNDNNLHNISESLSFPPPSVQKLFVDFATTPKTDFVKRLDVGVPIDEPMEGAEDVFILYSSNESVPTSVHRDGKRYLQSAEEATKTVKL